MSLLTFFIHVFAGGPTTARPLLASKDLAPVPKYTNYYCWHLVSLMLAAMSLGFALSVWERAPLQTALWTILAGASTVWSVVLFISKQQKPLHLPQWILFLPITILGILGLWAG